MPPEAPAAPPAAAPAAPAAPSAASVVPPPVSPGSPPKPGSARERLFNNLQKIGKDSNTSDQPSRPQAGQAPPDNTQKHDNPQEPPKNDSMFGDDAEGLGTGETGEPDPGTKPQDPGTNKPKKDSPWKLLDTYKKRTLELERQVQEMKSGSPPAEEVKAMQDRLAKAEARAKALDEEIKYHNFSLSEEFQTKYQAPYEAAWKRAMNELGEISVVDPESGSARAVSHQDMLDLIMLPLDKARDLAESIYGKFWPEAMNHRREIKGLFDAQTKALEDAKKNAVTRDKEMSTKTQQVRQEIAKQITETWTQANQQATEDPTYGEFFKPSDGDEEGNKRLAKGFAFVDEAFKMNPQDPRLTPEQRAQAVKRHAALRNRAAAFGRLTHLLKKERSQVAALRKELDQYKASEPGLGDGRPNTNAPILSARDRLHNNLRKIAH